MSFTKKIQTLDKMLSAHNIIADEYKTLHFWNKQQKEVMSQKLKISHKNIKEYSLKCFGFEYKDIIVLTTVDILKMIAYFVEATI